MDKKKFLDMMRNLQSLMRCPSCGSVYETEEMQFVGQGDGYFLLSMTCAKCALPVWVNVFSGQAGPSGLQTDLTVTDFDLMTKEPITPNEVIGFHLALKEFRGDFKSLFNK